MEKERRIEKAYQDALEAYAAIGVDGARALEQLAACPISIHCWQTDDVTGCEPSRTGLDGGIQATGNHPGKARTITEIRQDLEKVFDLVPGRHRLNLHASYADTDGEAVERNRLEPKHFQSWIAWAKKMGIGLDFNSTLFSHPMAAGGFTLSSKDAAIREFWIEHVEGCRRIGSHIGRELGTACIHNIWIPDGSKDLTVDRFAHRALLKASLDTIFSHTHDPHTLKDALEAKLFGIGMEACTVGSHEFYLGYAVKRNTLLCLDIGHFHPTEQVSDKVSSVFQFIDELLFHVTRPIRWDSDHVVILNDEVRALMQEIVWADKLAQSHIGLDFFDASINRIGAYVIGIRAAQKALLIALLDPIDGMRRYDNEGKNFQRLALMEEAKSKPFGAIWDYFCLCNQVPIGESYIAEIETYENEVLSRRA